ncbi:MAG: sulfotransferase family 2 domain-containing protein [Cyanobacteria bacterium P01_F01_bin.150]
MISMLVDKLNLLYLVEPNTFVRRLNVKLKQDWNNEKWAEKRFIVNHDYKFIYCPIFKNASTSMLSAILSISNCRQKEKLLSGSEVTVRLYVDLNYSLASYSYEAAQKFIEGDYFRFVIVRNPWARIASAYCNFFVRLLQKGIVSEFAKDVSGFVADNIGTSDGARHVTFEQLVEYVCATEDSQLNKHCLPQYLFMGDTKFDYIVRMENLDEGLKYVCNTLNLPLKLPEINKTRYDSSKFNDEYYRFSSMPACELASFSNGLPDYRAFYNPRLIDMIGDRYAKSIQLFNYDFV